MSGLDNTSFTVRTITTTSDTMTNNDYVTVWTNTSAKTANLPAVASVQPGRKYEFINTAAGTVTIDAFGSETINGATTLVLVAGTAAGAGRCTIVSDGTQWWTLTVQ